MNAPKMPLDLKRRQIPMVTRKLSVWSRMIGKRTNASVQETPVVPVQTELRSSAPGGTDSSLY